MNAGLKQKVTLELSAKALRRKLQCKCFQIGWWLGRRWSAKTASVGQTFLKDVLLLPARICPFFFQRGAPESVVGRMANDSLAV